MNNVLKDRFKDEIETIKGYVEYIENNFYRRSYQVLRTQGFEEFEILKDYVLFTEDETEKEKNRDILEQIGVLIRTKIEECTETLRNAEKVPLPQISNTILENDLQDCLCGYLKEYVYDRVNNPNNLPYSKLIETVNGWGNKRAS